MIRIVALLVALAAIVGIAGVLVLAALKPDTFAVERTMAMKAPADRIFPYINDLHRFATWSPFERKDPGMKRAFSGPASGKGARYDWDGDSSVGQGYIAILESSAPDRVVMGLDMVRPLRVHNTVEFKLETRGEATNVTWSMRGRVPYAAKIAHVIFDMDRMVGGDFEAGLASLRALVEKEPAPARASQ